MRKKCVVQALPYLKVKLEHSTRNFGIEQSVETIETGFNFDADQVPCVQVCHCCIVEFLQMGT